MIYILLNLWPILAATAAGFAAGILWYSVLGKPWMSTAEGNGNQTGSSRGFAAPVPLLVGFVCEFWIASILAGALILAPERAGEWMMAIGTAFIIWIGFILPAFVTTDRFERRSWRRTAINGGHWLVVVLVHVIVLQALGLEAPPDA